MKDWELENVEVAQAENPDSFFIPSEVERNCQKAGDLVRLHFLLSNRGPGLPRAERMWVEVTRPTADACHYEGVLTNQPGYLQGIKKGDTVQFGSQHIARIRVRRDDPRWLDCGEQIALVSRMIFDKGEMVRFAYREEPNNEEDSGWRLFAGKETDDYANQTQNTRKCNVYWLLDFDSTLLPILRNGVGSVFERADKTMSWETITDWKPREE
jgi:hypothetical protein